MKTQRKKEPLFVQADRIALLATLAASCLWSQAALASSVKNWTPPKEKIHAQTITEQVMKQHPELLYVGLHGVPPGTAPKTYTMIGSSFPERVGNSDDPDDILIIENGITILEPSPPGAPVSKFGYAAPLRDAKGATIGAVVMSFKNDKGSLKDEDVLRRGNSVRAEVEKMAGAFEDYFKPAK